MLLNTILDRSCVGRRVWDGYCGRVWGKEVGVREAEGRKVRSRGGS